MRRSTAVLAAVLLLAAAPGLASRAEELGWAGQLGGSQGDEPRGIAVDPSGSVYVAGGFEGTCDFDPGPGSVALTSRGATDAFVTKLDAAGRLVWARSVGSASADEARALAVDADGNVWIVGHFQGTADFDPGPKEFLLTASSYDAFVWKLTGGGDFIWAGAVGGSSSDLARGVTTAGFGAVYVTGYFAATADCDPGPGVYDLTSAGGYDAFVLKLDGRGGLLWARGMGGASQDMASSVAVAGDDEVWTVGQFQGSADFDPGSGTFWLTAQGSAEDGFVSRLDRAGRFLSAGRVGGTAGDRFDSIASRGLAGAFAVGSFGGTADLDPGPGVDARSSAGGYDAFVTMLDDRGEAVWTVTLGSSLDDYARAVAQDASGEVWAVGDFRGTLDFDPGPESFELTSVIRDAFAWKLDPTGAFRWAGRFGGDDVDDALAVAPGIQGGAWVAGYFPATADLDPGPDAFPLTSAGGTDVFVARLDRCGAFVDPGRYGRLVFGKRCTEDAGTLPGAPGTPFPYGRATIPFHRVAWDRVFLSSSGDDFLPLAVDDELHIGGLDSGLGPYGLQPGVPPFLQDVPIERNLVVEPPLDVTGLIPLGFSSLAFEAVDLDRVVLGTTPVYLVNDCGLIAEGRSPTTLRFVAHDATVLGLGVDFDVRAGALSDLAADRGFARAACLGRFLSNPAQDVLPDPPPGEGRYYLARALGAADGCSERGYGEAAGIVPDPRDALDPLPACP